MKPRVLYLIGQDNETSVPLEVAENMNADLFEVMVAAYYEKTGCLESQASSTLINVGAHSKFDLRSAFALFKLIKTYRPHVIHVHHTVSAFWGSLLGYLLGGAAIIKTEHTSHRRFRFYQHVPNAVTLLISDIVLCNSNCTGQSFYPWEKWITAQKRRTVYNGVDIERVKNAARLPFPDRERIGVEANEFLLGSVGRLVKLKNYKRLIQALSIARRTNSDLKLVIVGDGRLRENLEQDVRTLGVGEHVTFTGALGRDRVYNLLHVMDAFVMPSLYEGFCNAVVEAMAASKPVLCADIDTLREVVGPDGLFVDPHSPNDMARGIVDLAASTRSELKERGEKVCARASSMFPIQDTVLKYSDVYLEAFQNVQE